MKFSIGYQLLEDDSLISKIIEYKDRVHEVFFSFGDFPNGRNNQTRSDIFTAIEATEKQMQDLSELSRHGIRLNLLFNGNCYGKDSLSRKFFEKIGDTADFIDRRYGLSSITVTSPIIAKFFKTNFENIEVRASVNMEIGSIEGIDYISDCFDSFYIKRELNRNFSMLKRLKNHCDSIGKKMYGLANSGCLNNCSVHNFHDNLVAHENDIASMDNAYAFKGKCWDYLASGDNAKYMIRNTNFIRPEDVGLYEEYFTALKLATRINSAPCKVITAYMNGKYFGGINEILEPNHSSIISPAFIDNSKFPKDFALIVGMCNKECESCNYCSDVYKSVYTILNGGYMYVDKQND